MTSPLANLSDDELKALYTRSMPQAQDAGLGGMSDDALMAAYAKQKPDETTWYERGARGVQDVIQGAAQLGSRLPMPFLLNREKKESLPARVDEETRRSVAEYEQRRGENAGKIDPMRIAGNVVGTLPLAFAAPAAATIPGAIGAGTLVGGATGALQPVTEGDFWSEKGKQTGLGAATGGVGAGLIQGISRVVSPRVDPAIKQLMDKGVTPTPGQILGGVAKKAEDVTGIGQKGVTAEFNIAAVNDALKPLGVALPKGVAAGQAALQEANNLVKTAYDDVWSAARSVSLDATAAKELDDVLTEAARKLKPDQLAQFQTLMQDGLSGIQGQLTADKVRAGTEALRQSADDFMRAGGGERIMGRLFEKLATSLEGTALRTNAELAAAKKAADTAYAGMVRINEAAAKDVGESIFSPAQLASTVRSNAGKKQTAQGTGMLQDIAGAGMKVLSPRAGGAAAQGLPMMLGAAGLGASGLTSDPTYAALGMGAAGLYTPAGRRAFATMMTQRPDKAKAIAEALRNVAPFVAGSSANIRIPEQPRQRSQKGGNDGRTI